jgi:glycosyltransferase involved in cell wall biosynthesis
MTRVSVIIPAYNAMNYLAETLESVLKQTFTNFEVLIINDGSSDNIVEWASEIQDARVRLICQDNQGLAGARNTGIWCSKGEYLAFLDADDIWEPTKLEKQVKCLNENADIGLVSCWISHVDENGNIVGFTNVPKFTGTDLKRELFTFNNILCGSTPILRRSCFEKVGFFERSLKSAEDWDMWLRIARYYSISVIREPLVRYRHHSNNMSKNLRVMVQEVDKVMERAYKSPPPEMRRLKGVGGSLVRIYAAWECINKGDIPEAFGFAKQALIQRPQLVFSISYFHLLLLIFAKRFLKPHTYKFMHSLLFNRKQENETQYE